ncbi:MAG: helix-turn-helix transcriptional regulator [Acidobacteria bacterium]|nr:helix-turn-helix transcriptional regulator [Acidobacteriota bacterium]
MRISDHFSFRASGELSPRERQVTTLVARGMTNREVAASLGISRNTLKNQLRSVFEKLGVRNRLELVWCAISRGLVLSPEQMQNPPARKRTRSSGTGNKS